MTSDMVKLLIQDGRVLSNQFEIDSYAKTLRHFKRHVEISGGKSTVASDSDKEINSEGDD